MRPILIALCLVLAGCAGAPNGGTASVASTPKPSASPEVKIDFKAELIRKDGVRLKVIGAKFLAVPYSVLAVREKAAGRPEPKCTSTSDNDLYQTCLRDKEAWTAEYKKNYFDALASELTRLKVGSVDEVRFTTDANGMATIQLIPGDWYFTANYELGDKFVSWTEVKVKVTPETTSILMDNHNSTDDPFNPKPL
ncbi:MAG: hypothetical protein ACAI44_14190 [Candidatus Sericytochromatia bacterium]